MYKPFDVCSIGVLHTKVVLKDARHLHEKPMSTEITLSGLRSPITDSPFSTFGSVRSIKSFNMVGTDFLKLMLKERGYIYVSQHEGWYSVSDETFYPPTAVQLALDPSTGRKFMVGS